jgi:hypothetical protein
VHDDSLYTQFIDVLDRVISQFRAELAIYPSHVTFHQKYKKADVTKTTSQATLALSFHTFCQYPHSSFVYTRTKKASFKQYVFADVEPRM